MNPRLSDFARLLRGALFLAIAIGAPMAWLFLMPGPSGTFTAILTMLLGVFVAYVFPLTYFYNLISVRGPAVRGYRAWLDEIFHSGIEMFVAAVASMATGYAIVFRTLGLIDAKAHAITHDPSTALYFSTTTMSTLGPGDFRPLPDGRLLASLEAISGLIILAMAFVIFRRLTGGMFSVVSPKS